MNVQPSLLADAAANLGDHMRGKPAVLWRRPDPTDRLVAASGLGVEALLLRLKAERGRARRASAFEVIGFVVNLGALFGIAAWSYESWPVPPLAYAGLLAALIGTLHFATQVRGRTLRARNGFGGGEPHPDEGRPSAMAITPSRLYVAGSRGRPRELHHAHLHAIEILDRGRGDHLIRFWFTQKDGPGLFAQASRVPEASARALVEAMRGRCPRFEGVGERFAAELDARTVVLSPETFDAAAAAVAGGRFRTVGEAANAALTQALAA